MRLRTLATALWCRLLFGLLLFGLFRLLLLVGPFFGLLGGLFGGLLLRLGQVVGLGAHHMPAEVLDVQPHPPSDRGGGR